MTWRVLTANEVRATFGLSAIEVGYDSVSWNRVPVPRGPRVSTHRITPERYVEIARAVKLPLFPFPVKVGARLLWDNPRTEIIGVTTAIELEVPDRDDGSPRQITFSWDVPASWIARMTERDVLERVRRFLYEAMSHEIDEAIHFEGKRVFDPHPKPIEIKTTVSFVQSEGKTDG